MHRILIFGNSGSGKSTLANKLGKDFRIPILDLDTIVWEPNQIAIRRTQKDSAKDLQDFIENNISWIIEGCYSTLIKAAKFHKENPHSVYEGIPLYLCQFSIAETSFTLPVLGNFFTLAFFCLVFQSDDASSYLEKSQPWKLLA